MGDGFEKVGINGVWGVRPPWPRVMSYPALMEKVDVGGPTGGADRTAAAVAGGGPLGGPRDGTEGGERGAKGPLKDWEAADMGEEA
jgi:hypothetical protein